MEKSGIHVAVVMDGNGRSAEAKNKPRLTGHRRGGLALKDEVLPALLESTDPQISELSLYCFSTENWKRSRTEIVGLMSLIGRELERLIPQFNKHGVQIQHAGRQEKLKKEFPRTFYALKDAEVATRNNTRYRVNLCVDYGGTEEIQQAAVKAAANDEPENILDYLYITNPVDMVIRTGGEHRSSNFLPHQTAYAEWFFTNTYFPDIQRSEIEQMLQQFLERERRLGAQKS